MTEKRHPNRKRIIVTKEDGEVYRVFDTIEDCAEFFGRTKTVIYNHCAKPDIFYRENNILVRFQSESIGRKKETTDPIRSDVIEKKLRATETEDQTRRRLGLNPYGEWRNDEWLNAMFERVDRMLYPDGYDAHAAWLSMKGKERVIKGQRRESEEERLSREIDEEFLDYTK